MNNQLNSSVQYGPVCSSPTNGNICADSNVEHKCATCYRQLLISLCLSFDQVAEKWQ